jgi:uncharacterized protein YndB with AHSA1/START domain/predicted Ser/Thr protein kinase
MSGPDSNPTEPRSDPTVLHGRDAFTPLSVEALGARIPNLEVTELLGQGGMGVVYKGRQTFLDRSVAIKVPRPDFHPDDDFRERFLREARTLAKLRHPYIVTLYDAGVSDQLYYLVMEYVEGTSLRQLLIDKVVSERYALEFVQQIADGLQHAHEAGVVHRDIKPENLIVDSRGRVRLVDFGLATLFGGHARGGVEDDRIAGTLAYMAPEQISTPKTVDHRADIYSTGVVFYEMLANELPKADRQPPSRKAATDPRLDPIVLRALERERERRYQEARVLHQEIDAVARTPESTIRVAQMINAPVDQVFAAWITPAAMSEWYAPFDAFGPSDCEADPQVGGRYTVQMHPPGQDAPSVVTGQYCRIDAPRTLSFTWAWETPRADTHETQVTLEFRPRGEATELVLTHDRFRDAELRAAHAQGWQGCLERLAREVGK